MHRLAVVLVLSVCLVLFLWAGWTLAQKPPSPEAVKETAVPQKAVATDPLGRDTPAGTVIGFLLAAEKGDYDRALDYLDTKLPRHRTREVAEHLLVVLNQEVKLNVVTLSKDPEGDTKDNLPLNKERIGVVKTDGGTVDIMLEHVKRGSDPPIWVFSAETLKHVSDIYAGVEKPWIERHVPQFIVEARFLNVQLWRLLVLIIALLFALMLAWASTRAILPLLRIIVCRFFSKIDDRAAIKLAGPVRILILALIFYTYSTSAFSLIGRSFAGYMWATVAIVGFVWLFLRLIDIGHEVRESKPLPEKALGRIATLRLASTILKGLVIIAGAVVILYMAGVKLTPVIAGLGVGGVAVAFAAQKTLENLFGGIMIASDRPIRKGDFCRAGDYLGTVVDIGLRSTRLRTLGDTIVSVPNGQLSQMSLENFSMRGKILFNHKILLRLETSADQLRFVLEQTQGLLQGHPKVEPVTCRVRLSGLKQSGFELELFAYVLETDFVAFLLIQEELLLHVVEIIEASGTSFAVPLPLDGRPLTRVPN
jgi:MscS family membrane protein